MAPILGKKTSATQRAMRTFTERVNATLPVEEPDYILLTLLQGQTGLACGKTCPAGQVTVGDGRCEARAILTQKSEKQLRQQQEAEAKRAEAQRQENLRRMQGLAGATGAENATGNATRSSGPSDSYAGRIRARIKPNIVFTEDVAGNPVTEVEVRMAPDGTITQRRITKPSTSKSWDDAVLRALDRTAKLPTDLDGRVHTPLIMTFRPRD